MQKNDVVRTWNPWPILSSNDINSKYAVMILNRPIQTEIDSDVILKIWENAVVRIVVDGGADIWLSWLKKNQIDPDGVTRPELLTGDMDSVTKRALQYFGSSGKTKVVVTGDQSKTDFTKAIIELHRHLVQNSLKLDDVMVFTASSGRFDQLLSNINTLYHAGDYLPGVKVYIFTSDSLTWLLPKGSHIIHIPSNLRENQEWCGLIPIGAPCLVTTRGLKWNLTKRIMEFGGLISSSNTYNGEPEVSVHTNSFLVWSMGVKYFFKDCKSS